ncbi:MAG: 8-amino-7-oxononanoate synthase [Elusimicrobia bacterium]|nr:8-amino-7-oxononanoate synthase [Candidatus Liberimonas magnetica]
MKKELTNELEVLKEKGLYRSLKIISSYSEKEIVIDGIKYMNFSSNNYLGMSLRPEVKKAAIDAINKYGCGGTSSRLICGTLDVHKELEEKLARLKSKEASLVFPSGFSTNQGIISTLFSSGDAIIMDKLNHASLWDGASLSKARIFIYEHKDMESLEKILKRAQSYKKRLIVTDTVFSMDGDLAPLKEIAYLAKKYSAVTMIDEAHATGVFGEKGSGLAEELGVEKEIDIVMGTLSKAIGSSGGFVCADKETIEYLINKSRAFIYTTSLAPASVCSAIKALEIIEREPEKRKKLLENAKYLKNNLNALGFDTLESESQIIPLFTGEVSKTLEISSKLMDAGIYVPAIRPPTVAEGRCRLRFSLTSQHSKEDIDKLIETIKTELKLRK